jgi:hypothetical protein
LRVDVSTGKKFGLPIGGKIIAGVYRNRKKHQQKDGLY